MHIVSTNNILADLAEEMDLNQFAAEDLLDHVLAPEDDGDSDEFEIAESRRSRW